MAFLCRVLEHTSTPEGQGCVTFELEYPRILIAEVVTHRILSMASEPTAEYLFSDRTSGLELSKSSASSRAVPFLAMVEKLIGDPAKCVPPDPYIPNFSINQGGMQEAGFLDAAGQAKAQVVWLRVMQQCIDGAAELHAMGVHKQDINRVLEPFSWVRQVVTGTEWANFFALRTHKDAHPAIRKIAQAMYVAKSRSKPRPLAYGEWHLPYVGVEDRKAAADIVLFNDNGKYSEAAPFGFACWEDAILARWSAARCARTSYKLFDGRKANLVDDELLCDKLFGGEIKHVSPAEHQGTPATDEYFALWPKMRSNLRGYVQHRRVIPGETVREFSPSQETVDSWMVPEETFDEEAV